MSIKCMYFNTSVCYDIITMCRSARKKDEKMKKKMGEKNRKKYPKKKL